MPVLDGYAREPLLIAAPRHAVRLLIKRKIWFEAHQNTAIVAHTRLIIKRDMLPHYVDITPPPLHWVVFENRSRAREVHQVIEYFTRLSSYISAASEQS